MFKRKDKQVQQTGKAPRRLTEDELKAVAGGPIIDNGGGTNRSGDLGG